MTKFTVTILIDNRVARDGLVGEHGLAFLVEADGGGARGLFDAGQTNAFVANARAMGLSLKGLSWVALSHGHFDHTGGLRALLDAAGPVDVYAHPEVFAPRFSRDERGGFRRIGAPVTYRELEEAGARIGLRDDAFEVSPGCRLTGEVPRRTDFETPEPGFFVERGGDKTLDLIPDDQSLILETDDGLTVLLGCAHAGVVNTLLRVRELAPGRPVRAVVGGMHLVHASRGRIEKTVSALREMGVERVGPAHCSGADATRAFAEAFGDGFVAVGAGAILKF